VRSLLVVSITRHVFTSRRVEGNGLWLNELFPMFDAGAFSYSLSASGLDVFVQRGNVVTKHTINVAEIDFYSTGSR
jgi:hypothetical protein